MAICIFALPILAILGIFSATHRKLAFEALDCVWRKSTFRPCRSSLDDRLQAMIIGKILKRSVFLGRVINKNFTVFSYLFVGLLILSSYYSLEGAFNYYYYGNCNGPDELGFCLLDPSGENSGHSLIDGEIPENIIFPTIEKNDPILGNPNSQLIIIEFGCFACPFTKKAEPTLKEVMKNYNVSIQYKSSLINSHNLSFESALAANCAFEQGKYKPYHDKLFELQGELSEDDFFDLAKTLGLNKTRFTICYNNKTYEHEIKSDHQMALNAGVIATPTFFINERRIVGPKPYRTFATIIEEELY
jgi:protein-disulfide isomerase